MLKKAVKAGRHRRFGVRYLITGGAGFIGGHLTEALLKTENNEVTVFDNLSTGSLSNLAAVIDDKRLRFIEGDIVSAENMDAYVKEADVIYHLAAAVGVELVVNAPAQTIVTNVHGTENVINAAVKFDKRIIIASTSEVYGKSSKERFCETDDLLIGCPTHSRWSYACSKLLDEFYLMAFYHSRNLKGTVVRLFNTVGPRQTGQYGMVVPRFVASALGGNELTVYGSGNQTRCFCHVFDTVRALLALADCPESQGGIYNVGSHNRISIRELAELIIKQLGSTSKIVQISYDEAYEKGFEDMLHRAPDTSAIETLLGWKPRFSLYDIIHDVAESIRSATPQKGRRNWSE
ncbi:MAG: GDP-mannose 4,6-dehydratase [Victivallales bacterium]|nr:GDP-mannose 4,6-dehydratase [Victivallales bacterium]